VVFRDGQPSLRSVQGRALLQNRARIQHLSRFLPATFMLFDLPYLKGKPLLATPFIERREMLVKLYEQFQLPNILLSEGLRRCGCRLFTQAMRLSLEGVMAKRLDSPYLPGKRSRHWLKIKSRRAGPK
jgi:ATP-dependent DNA ligase